MKIKDLKEKIRNLPDNMHVAHMDKDGYMVNAVCFVDGVGEEDESDTEWLCVAPGVDK